MIDEERRLHEIAARAGRGERREGGPDTAITPTAAPGQGPVDPAMRALETYLEASLDRLLSGSEASPSGLLVLSAWHEAMPTLVHLDPVLEAVDSRVFAVLWLWAREQARSTVAFPSYDYLIKRTNLQARSTVARSLAILRITRWVTLCRRVRDRSGRYRGNIYALHDEPLGLGSSFYLDPGYMTLVRGVLTARHIGLMDRREAERCMTLGTRPLRRAMGAALGSKYEGVKREDLREGNAKAQKARERMGDVPPEILDGRRRARHAPERRPIVKPAAGTAGLMRSGGLLDLPGRSQ